MWVDSKVAREHVAENQTPPLQHAKPGSTELGEPFWDVIDLWVRLYVILRLLTIRVDGLVKVYLTDTPHYLVVEVVDLGCGESVPLY